MTTEERLNRWRLILGRESDERFAPMGAAPLSAEELLMDQALAAIYGGPGESFSAGGRGAGNRSFFPAYCQMAWRPALAVSSGYCSGSAE